jgi:hypothetical protein
MILSPIPKSLKLHIYNMTLTLDSKQNKGGGNNGGTNDGGYIWVG